MLVLSDFFFCRHVFKKPFVAEASESVMRGSVKYRLRQISNVVCLYQGEDIPFPPYSNQLQQLGNERRKSLYERIMINE